MRAIPKNVRQIGDLDGDLRLYVEDYVNTFIRKCARTDRLVLGALVGDWYMQDGKEYLFVEGAVQADEYEVVDGRIHMTDESWSGIYGKLGEFFEGRSICGWFLCGGETVECDVGMLRGFMYENIGHEKRALVLCDVEMDEEAFFVYDRDFIREQSGYYLFYERNESMQSYMVTTSVAVRTDPVAVDAARMVRTRRVEPREIPVQQGGYSMMSAAAMVVGVIALAFGIVTMNHYEQLKQMKSVLTNLTGAFLGNGETDAEIDDEAGNASTESTETGGLIIEDVEGGVSPEESDPEPSESSGEGQTDEEMGAVSGTEVMDDKTEEETVDAPGYYTYIVKEGDTLVSICWSVYGSRDDEIIRRICEINQISDKDHIYAGQELLIP